MLKAAETDPEVKTKLLAKEYGITLASASPEEKIKKQIREKAFDAALQQLSSNPELLQQFTANILQDTIENSSSEEEYGDEEFDESRFGHSGSPIREYLDMMDDMDELNERMGRGKKEEEEPAGWLQGLFSGGTGQALIMGILGALTGKQLSQGPAQPQIPGGNGQYQLPEGRPVYYLDGKEVDEATAQQIIMAHQQAANRPVVNLNELVKATPVNNNGHDAPAAAAPQPSQPQQQEQPPSFDISEWMEYLDQPPQEFVNYLVAGATVGNFTETIVLEFLKNSDIDGTLEWLNSMKADPTYKDHIERIVAKPEWMEEAIEIIHNLYEGIPSDESIIGME